MRTCASIQTKKKKEKKTINNRIRTHALAHKYQNPKTCFDSQKDKLRTCLSIQEKSIIVLFTYL